MAEVAEASTDNWWIMGDTEGNYVHWKGDSIFGCYIQVCDPETAERFKTKDDAIKEIATPYVQNELDWGGGKIIPLKVTKTIKVLADL